MRSTTTDAVSSLTRNWTKAGLDCKSGGRDAPLHDLRETFELGTIPPKQIQVAGRTVSEVHACESCAAAQNERRLDAPEDFENPPLDAAQLTA